jgi:hypothetical protein
MDAFVDAVIQALVRNDLARHRLTGERGHCGTLVSWF